MKTSELTGALLDYWVARVEGLQARPYRLGEATARCWTIDKQGRTDCVFSPSTSWAQGGPIIERERIRTQFDVAGWDAQTQGDDWIYSAPTPLVAAMRAYVASKFGNEVEDTTKGQA